MEGYVYFCQGLHKSARWYTNGSLSVYFQNLVQKFLDHIYVDSLHRLSQPVCVGKQFATGVEGGRVYDAW